MDGLLGPMQRLRQVYRLMSWFCSSVISPHNVISPHKQGSFDFSRARLGMRMSLPSLPARGCWGTGKGMVSSLPGEGNFDLRPSFAARGETRMKLALTFPAVCPQATDSFLKIGHLTVSQVPYFRDNCRAISSAPHHLVLQSTKASAATYGLDCRCSNIPRMACCSLVAGAKCPLWRTT
jgi:hypothetical protein